MIMDIEEVTQKVIKYISLAGYYIAKVTSVSKDGENWVVLVDVGAYDKKLKKVIIQDLTGKVVGFE